MIFKKILIQHCKYYCLFVLLLFSSIIGAQTTMQEKMEDLAFMIGNWVGTSTTIENGKVSKQVPAYQSITYDVNKSIIVIELESETLKLHTIIQYDEKDKIYYYYPFSERGTGKLPAEYSKGKLIVNANKNKRYTFERTGENSFREYGEKLIEGNWVKYFEDTFTDSQ